MFADSLRILKAIHLSALLRGPTNVCLFASALWTTLTFIGLNWGLQANYIMTLLKMIVSNQVGSFPACRFPSFHLGTRIPFQGLVIHHPTSLSWLTNCQSFRFMLWSLSGPWHAKEGRIYCGMFLLEFTVPLVDMKICCCPTNSLWVQIN